MGLFNKKELKRIAELEKQLESLGAKEFIEIQELTKKAREEYTKLNETISLNNQEIEKLQNQISQKKQTIEELDLTIELINDFGLYEPKYDFSNSEEYSEEIKKIRTKQKEMIKNKTALNWSDSWTLDGSKSKGRAMNNDNMKMYLRAFNNECDVLISKVKFNNFDKIEERIKKCVNALDKLNQRNKISMTKAYLSLKIDELHLVHEYNCKKQEEKEILKAAREEEREKAKLQKEIIEARKKISKEQAHYEKAKEQLLIQLANSPDSEVEDIKNKIKELDIKLEEIENNLKDIDYREANQKAGYVYIISNIGSFGEGVYKIGMTRRLDPQDRIDELGDASVPFKFDVHAMIFSEDAPKLEATLHHVFEKNKVNMINGRKEFFRVPLEEIEKVVKENHDKLIKFKEIPDAEQYRESLKIKQLING